MQPYKDPTLLNNFRANPQTCYNLTAPLLSEMYCHVYGPIYGCLEHRVPNVQLQITEGKGSHVNVPLFTLTLPQTVAYSEEEHSAPPEVTSTCTGVWRHQQQHTINCHHTSQTGRESLWTLAITMSLWTFSFCSEEQFSKQV